MSVYGRKHNVVKVTTEIKVILVCEFIDNLQSTDLLEWEYG